jgi:ribosomal protein S14
MTTSDHKKMFEQIKNKPGKVAKYKKYNVPKERKQGENTKKCKLCGRTGGHISKYGIHLCRHCFRDNATQIGFKKYS